MKYTLTLFFLASFLTFSQDSWEDFSGKERAFFYHQSRRVEILKPTLFHLFEFKDSIPYINDTLPDYNYVERRIVEDPDLLFLHQSEISRNSVGIVSDLALRFALWELDMVLQFRNSTAKEDEHLKVKLGIFEKYVLENAPQSAVRTLTNGDYVLDKILKGYYAPSLTVADKMAAIVNSGYSSLDQMLVVNAIMSAEEKYVNQRTRQVYKALGGKTDGGVSFISAVGDGSNWAEIVGGFNTPYTIGLPDEKGLFKFEIAEVFNKEREINEAKVTTVTRKQLTTSSQFETVVHVDVFGYHPERQTTIAIQKGGNSYVLYGKNEHRLVSPDSLYGTGTTYWRLMNRLEFYHIAHLKEDLYGKRGYEYQIDLTEKQIEVTKLRIKKTEYRLDKLRHTPEGKPKIKKKKLKKKDLGKSDQDGGGHPTSRLSKLDKEKNIEQSRLVQLNGQFDDQKRHLAALKVEMDEAFEKLIFCEAKLDLMKKNVGYEIMDFEQENHLFTFSDGATFNYLTQDFTFPVDERESVYQIYHISFGEKVFDEKADENFAHIHISKRVNSDTYLMKRVKRDNGKQLLSIKDSIQIQEIFYYLSQKNMKPTLTVKAGGVVGEKDMDIFRDSTRVIQDYNAENTPNAGVEIYGGTLNATIDLTVSVYDDPMIPANFNSYNKVYAKFKAKNPTLNEVDFYTGLRAKKAAVNWISLLKELAKKWIKDDSEKRIVLAKLSKLKVKKVVFHNGSEIKVPSLIE